MMYDIMEDHFYFFKQARIEYAKQKSVSDNESSDYEDDECVNVPDQPSKVLDDHKILDSDIFCEHTTTSYLKGVNICMDCGMQTTRVIDNGKDGVFYKTGSRNGDPTRVQARKVDERTIFKDVENMGFSDKIVSEANKLYSRVSKGNTYRSNSRKSIIFACIFHAYKLSGKPQIPDGLVVTFGISKKSGLRGLKHVYLNIPKDEAPKAVYITPINIIEDIMDTFKSSQEKKNAVREIYNSIRNKSSKLNRSRPQSVAAGVVWYWISLNKKDITIEQFVDVVHLSVLTIEAIVEEIKRVMRKDIWMMKYV